MEIKPIKINNQTKRKEAIRKLLKEVLYNSLAQTIIRIIQTPYLFLKVFLTIFVLTTTGLASYLVIHSIVDYLTYGVSTTSRTIFENPTLFPKVTICNLNSYTTEFAYNLTRQGVYYGNDLSNEDKSKLGHYLEDILIECKFNGFQCTPKNFTWSFDEVYGNCYTFNSGFDSNGNRVDLKQSKISGPRSGLQLKVYVNFYEGLLGFFKQNGLGAVIRIGNSSYSTFFDANGVLVSPGFQTNIAVDREFKFMLPKPYSNCEINSNSPTYRPDSDLYSLIGHSVYDYTQQLCFSQCRQSRFIKKKNCSLPFTLSLYNASQCNDYDYGLLSHYGLWSLLDENPYEDNFLNDFCLPLCPLECNQTLYKTSISFSQLLGTEFISHIKKNPNLAPDFIHRQIDLTTVEKSVVSVNVFYESLSYTLSTESPQMDMVSLIASIGGNLSLFLGVSVFSLCEMLEVAIEMFYMP